MILQCTQCAGSVTAESDAIRKGVVSCNYCQTQLRITQTGIEKYKKQVLERTPPDKMQVKRRPNHLQILIPSLNSTVRMRGEQTPEWFRLTNIVALSIIGGGSLLFIIIGFALGAPSLGIAFIPMTLIAALFVWLFMLFIGSAPHPHINVKDGQLQVPTTMPGQKNKFPLEEITQLYVTTVRTRLPDTLSQAVYNLFVLTKDGKRHLAYNGFSSVEGALFVEELLEIELDIFDLPVYGEADELEGETAVTSSSHEQTVDCYACTNPMTVTPAARHNGFIECTHCQTITLLYTQNDHQLILGTPSPQQLTYLTAFKNERAGVKHKTTKETILLLKDGVLIKSAHNAVYKGKKITRFGFKKLTKTADEINLADIFSGKLIERYQDLTAYSQNTIDNASSIEMADILLSEITFVVMGQMDGKMKPLIYEIESLEEAAHIITVLNNYLNQL